MLDEGSFVERSTNWLKESDNKRSAELFQKASLETFKRLRMVERLLVEKQKFNADDNPENQNTILKATNIIQEHANYIRHHKNQVYKNIDEPHNPKDPYEGGYYYPYPYSISTTEMTKVIRWFDILNNNLGQNVEGGGIKGMEYLKELQAYLYMTGTDKISAENVLKSDMMKSVPTPNFADIVLSIVEEPLIGKKTPSRDPAADLFNATSLNLAEHIGARIIDSHQNFVNGIKKLSGGFNEIYQRGIQKSVQPAVK